MLIGQGFKDGKQQLLGVYSPRLGRLSVHTGKFVDSLGMPLKLLAGLIGTTGVWSLYKQLPNFLCNKECWSVLALVTSNRIQALHIAIIGFI